MTEAENTKQTENDMIRCVIYDEAEDPMIRCLAMQTLWDRGIYE